MKAKDGDITYVEFGESGVVVIDCTEPDELQIRVYLTGGSVSPDGILTLEVPEYG